MRPRDRMMSIVLTGLDEGLHLGDRDGKETKSASVSMAAQKRAPDIVVDWVLALERPKRGQN